MKQTLLPMNLQLFAESGNAEGQQNQASQQEGQQQQSNGQPSFDYDKLANILASRQAQNEESVLKGYFKQQGLSSEEMTQAIAAFKEQKAQSTPDISALQNQIQTAESARQKYMVESAATMAAVDLGIAAKTIPYVIKMADLSKVIGEDGNVNQEALTGALNKVLEDIPALKPAAQAQAGFVQVGAVVNPQQTQGGTQTQKQVASKPWNRINH